MNKIALLILSLILATVAGLGSCISPPEETPPIIESEPAETTVAPELMSPNNGTTGIELTPVLLWNEVPNAQGYEVLVSRNYDFSDIVHSVSTGITTYRIADDLLPSTQYYWMVAAKLIGGGWSPVWTFTTAPADFITTNIPTGPSAGEVGQTLIFSTSADSNIAGSPENRFDWGDGSYSSWSSSASASHSWSSPGTYMVRAQARHPGIVSEWSSGKVVKIEMQSLSRNPLGQPEQMKRYITPDDPKIKAAVNDILSGEWRWAYNDFNALRAWLALNISPISDQEAHGVAEYWQLPAETLELGTGDCEDYAILLCALLRANGIPADQVYVIGGYPSEGERGHAFLYEHWYKGIWRAIEPQIDPITDTLTFEIMGWVDAVTYIRDVWCFNDESCFQGKPALSLGVYEFEVDYSLYPLTRGATVEFERHLDPGQKVSGSVEWLVDRAWAKENYQIVWDWSLYVYTPDGSTTFTWSGTDLQHNFSFTPTTPGTYKIEILKRDYLARCARLTIDPPDWSKR